MHFQKLNYYLNFLGKYQQISDKCGEMIHGIKVDEDINKYDVEQNGREIITEIQNRNMKKNAIYKTQNVNVIEDNEQTIYTESR